MAPQVESQFKRSFRSKLDSFGKNISSDPGAVRFLEEPTKREVLAFLIVSACASQSVDANKAGMECIARLPMRWTIQAVEEAAKKALDFDDDYEYRRLLDVYDYLRTRWSGEKTQVQMLIDRLVEVGLASGNQDVREDAEAFRARRRIVLTRGPAVPALAALARTGVDSGGLQHKPIIVNEFEGLTR